MAESSVPITAGAGTSIATWVDPSGFARQINILGDSINGAVAIVTGNGRQKVSPDHLLLHGMFSSGAQNTGVWKFISSTMTASQSGGYLLLNANSSLTTGVGCSIQSWRYVSFIDSSTYTVTIQILIAAGNILANQVMEWGLFVPTATAAPTEGVYFRYTSAGLIGVVNNNGTEATVALGGVNFFTTNVGQDTSFTVDERVIQFFSAGVLLGTLNIGAANSNIFQSLGMPLGMQCRNSGTVVGTAAQIKFACTSIFQNDITLNKPWAHQQQSIGYGYQGLEGGTMGSTALIANNQNTAAAALVNASAAAGFTGLGGHFNVLPTLTVGTDGILCDYTNPLGSTTQPARTMHITGVRIQGVVTTAFTGGSVAYLYTLCHGHTAQSLATAETGSFVTATAKAPRRIYLGAESWVVTAPVGAISLGGAVEVLFESPVIVNPGEHVAIAAKNMGIVTTLGAVAIGVGFDYYYE